MQPKSTNSDPKPIKVLSYLTAIFFLLLATFFTVQATSRQNERLIIGTVIDIGSCGGGEGYFSGPYECKVAVNVGGTIEYWTVTNKVIKGQSVSRACWDEKTSKGPKSFCDSWGK